MSRGKLLPTERQIGTLGIVTCAVSGVSWRIGPPDLTPPLTRLVSEEVIERALQSIVYEMEHTPSQAAYERCRQAIKELGGAP